LADMRSLRDLERTNCRSKTGLENPFQKHKQKRLLLDQYEYHGYFDNLVYNEIDVDWYSPSIYDVYFDDGYVF